MESKDSSARAPEFQRRPWFAALTYPNYRLWFCGQMVSLFGTWMQMTAQGYLLFTLTHSTAYLGYLSFVNGIPTWCLMLYAGVVADRLAKRTLLMLTQTVMMMMALILAWLTFRGVIQPWQILALAGGMGVANAFDAPARQSFAIELVGRADLTNAIALNGAMFNTATAIGPALGGVIYGLVGPGWCFMLNGFSFLAVILALGLMRLPPHTPPQTRVSLLTDLREGFRYVQSQPIMRALIALSAVAGLFGFAFIPLFPAWAVKVLGGNETTNGLLQSARGLGALIGALTIAALGRFPFKGRVFTVGTFLFPVFLFIFATTRQLPWALLTLVLTGFFLVASMNLSNALIQALVPDHLRGRVMAMYMFMFFGFMPIGGLFTGAVAEHVGEPASVMLNATLYGAACAVIWLLAPALWKLE